MHMPHARPKRGSLRKEGIHIKEASPDEVSKHSKELRRELIDSFSKAKLLPKGMTPEGMAKASIDNRSLHRDRRSLIAFDQSGRIVGASLHVPIKRKYGTSEEFGPWFISPKLGLGKKIPLMNRLVEESHDIMRKGGFERVLTPITTEEARKYMSRFHGYKLKEHDREDPGMSLWEKHLKDEKA